MLKPKPRTNGRHMVTIRTEHHLGGLEIAELLCAFHGNTDHAPDPFQKKPGTAMTRTEVEYLVRESVDFRGLGAYVETEFQLDYTEEEVNIVVQWAAEQVRHAYPELVDEKLEKWAASWAADAKEYIKERDRRMKEMVE